MKKLKKGDILDIIGWLVIIILGIWWYLWYHSKHHLDVWDRIFTKYWCDWWIVVWLSDEWIVTSAKIWEEPNCWYPADVDFVKKNPKHTKTLSWYEYLADSI